MLVNDNFPNKPVHNLVSEFLQNKIPFTIVDSSSRPSQASYMCESVSDQYRIHVSKAHTDSQDGTITLHYRNQMRDVYTKTERRMRKTIRRHV